MCIIFRSIFLGPFDFFTIITLDRSSKDLPKIPFTPVIIDSSTEQARAQSQIEIEQCKQSFLLQQINNITAIENSSWILPELQAHPTPAVEPIQSVRAFPRTTTWVGATSGLVLRISRVVVCYRLCRHNILNMLDVLYCDSGPKHSHNSSAYSTSSAATSAQSTTSHSVTQLLVRQL
jgi:hypothetical protein